MSNLDIQSCTPEDNNGNRLCTVEYKGRQYIQKVNAEGKCIESLSPMESPKEASEVKNLIEHNIKKFLTVDE